MTPLAVLCGALIVLVLLMARALQLTLREVRQARSQALTALLGWNATIADLQKANVEIRRAHEVADRAIALAAETQLAVQQEPKVIH